MASRLLARLAVLAVALLVLGCLPRSQLFSSAAQPPEPPKPPLTPRWAYEPWVWEDEDNNAEATLALVDDYRRLDIPVGVVIIDSPWQTNYNTFQFGMNYPDPKALIDALHQRGVRVVLWATPFINVSSIDGPERGKASNYDEAYAAGYFVDGGQTHAWDKGRGSAIDVFNPAAVAWLYRQMDRAFSLGIDGWKVDSPEGNLPDEFQTAAGTKTQIQYGEAYYRAFYRYVAERNPDAIIMARPYDGGTVYAPLDVNTAGWVGDQIPDWGLRGIEEALDNVLISAEMGYAVLGSDIGGYRPGPRFERLFNRWTQLGALSPLMENGGRGEHRPWVIDPDLVQNYRYYAKLHHQLVPYLYSAGIEAHRTGRPIIRDGDRTGRQYLLGHDLLVAPITTRDDEREVTLPAGASWLDYWDDEVVHTGPATIRYRTQEDRIPLLIRSGAIIPMQVSDEVTGHGDDGSAGRLTLLLYPDGESERTVWIEPGSSLVVRARREAELVTIDVGPRSERYVMRIKEPVEPDGISIQRGDQTVNLTAERDWQRFDRAEDAWHYDARRRYLWVRFSTTGEARLTYRPPGCARC